MSRRNGRTMLVHPTMSPRYYGFYLDGFREAFGWRVQLSTEGFPQLGDPKSGMAAILPGGSRVFIAANDFAHVDPAVVDWADVVGQVNVELDGPNSPKVLPIGPSFGTPWPSTWSLAAFIVGSGLRTRPRRIPAMLRDYLRHQGDREPLSAYSVGRSTPDEVFFLANYWSNAPEANRRRLRFLRAVSSVPALSLRGGIWGSGDLPEEYLPFRLGERVAQGEYLTSTQGSVVVFNTPAVHDCLGWKLAEFLALGKAIISTPLGRVMPGSFEHGQQVHIVEDDEDAMVDALELLAADADYRHSLERNARRYWDEYLAPASVARRISDAAGGGGLPGRATSGPGCGA